MKNFDFNQTDSVFRNQTERSKIKKSRKINWDRIIYFMLLIGLIIIVSSYFFNKFYYVKADGQVIFNSLDIQTIDDSRIISIKVKEGSEVKVGDTLFMYKEDNEDFNTGNGSVSVEQSNTNHNWKQKEFIEINQQIKLKENELDFKSSKYIRLKKDEEKTKNEVMVDALPKVEYHRLINSIKDLEQEILLTKNEIKILKIKLNQIKQLPLNAQKSSIISGGNGNGNSNSNEYKAFTSPIDGYVSKIFKEDFEVAIRSEVIMHLYQPKGVIVKAFFKQEDYNQIQKSDIVDVEFPDGTYSKGIVNMILHETNRLPEEFQKKFEPTTRVINVDIVPFSPKDLLLWKKFNKLSVTVFKSKYE